MSDMVTFGWGMSVIFHLEVNYQFAGTAPIINTLLQIWHITVDAVIVQGKAYGNGSASTTLSERCTVYSMCHAALDAAMVGVGWGGTESVPS